MGYADDEKEIIKFSYLTADPDSNICAIVRELKIYQVKLAVSITNQYYVGLCG